MFDIFDWFIKKFDFKKSLKVAIPMLIIFLALAGGVLYYIYLPVISIHSYNLWVIAIVLTVIMGMVFKIISKIVSKILFVLAGVLVIILLAGSILSSPIVNAKKFQKLLPISDSDFQKDIKQISYDEIPILDKATAINLGSRKMGSMIEMVSQFEVSDLYTQINYKAVPTRVTPLNYGNFFKWITNRREGIPAYMKIDMATQDVELVKVPEGIKYSFSEPFNRNVKRRLRFNYPTYIFDTINFEIDDNKTPFWIAPVRSYSIGLFGGPVIEKVITLNAITGELAEYNVEDVPKWIDTVYSADLLMSYYNYHGMLKNGFLNSVLGQKGCLKTTDGYNYIALDDDVYVYTGVTSAGGDKSNVGFVLMNMRTSDTKYYTISGAQESSAMRSAEGQVQNLRYTATFPLLLNIANEPTYVMALKDSAGLVKKYAMVNVKRYQVVAIGDTLLECENNYRKLLTENNIAVEKPKKSLEKSGVISYINNIVIDGNTNVFIKIGSDSSFFVTPIKNNINILNYSLNDDISITYTKNDDYNLIETIK